MERISVASDVDRPNPIHSSWCQIYFPKYRDGKTCDAECVRASLGAMAANSLPSGVVFELSFHSSPPGFDFGGDNCFFSCDAIREKVDLLSISSELSIN